MQYLMVASLLMVGVVLAYLLVKGNPFMDAIAKHLSATLPVVRTALRTALMPTVNAMAATGLVTLPGMMTGQILSGVEPQEAVKYQLLVMFLISGGTAIGSIAAVHGGI